MSLSQRRWNLELAIQRSSLITAWGNIDGCALSERPARCTSYFEALHILRLWLDEFDADRGDRIMGIVRAPAVPITAWSTGSCSAALYWFATQLGHSWLHLPEITRWSASLRPAEKSRWSLLESEPPLLTVSL